MMLRSFVRGGPGGSGSGGPVNLISPDESEWRLKATNEGGLFTQEQLDMLSATGVGYPSPLHQSFSHSGRGQGIEVHLNRGITINEFRWRGSGGNRDVKLSVFRKSDQVRVWTETFAYGAAGVWQSFVPSAPVELPADQYIFIGYPSGTQPGWYYQALGQVTTGPGVSVPKGYWSSGDVYPQNVENFNATGLLTFDYEYLPPEARTVYAAPQPVRSTVKTANYTLALADLGTVVEVNSTSAVTVTVPPNSAVAFPVGTVIQITRIGAGSVDIAPGSGVTLNSPGGVRAIADQYKTVSLRKRATNEWVLEL